MAERPRTSHQGRGRKPRQVGDEPQVVEPESDLAGDNLCFMVICTALFLKLDYEN